MSGVVSLSSVKKRLNDSRDQVKSHDPKEILQFLNGLTETRIPYRFFGNLVDPTKHNDPVRLGPVRFGESLFKKCIWGFLR